MGKCWFRRRWHYQGRSEDSCSAGLVQWCFVELPHCSCCACVASSCSILSVGHDAMSGCFLCKLNFFGNCIVPFRPHVHAVWTIFVQQCGVSLAPDKHIASLAHKFL